MPTFGVEPGSLDNHGWMHHDRLWSFKQGRTGRSGALPATWRPKLLSVLLHDRGGRFQANADGAAHVNEGTHHPETTAGSGPKAFIDGN
jgi:hypothetical protein